MWIDHDYFPFEVSRRFRCFFLGFIDDYDLRFQESRNRRLRQLDSLLSNQDEISALSQEWKRAAEKVSIFDWAQLVEWSEEYRVLCLKQEIDECLQKLTHSELDPTNRAILNRIREIEREIISLPKIETSSGLTLMRIRWKATSLNDEVSYLSDRLRTHSS